MSLPCVAYFLYLCLDYLIPDIILIPTLPVITIALMVISLLYIPVKVNNSIPQEDAFAIYLRSFKSDSAFGSNYENLLRSLINCFFPLYEIGNPNEVVKLIKKNITIYRSDDDWQTTIDELKANAKIILVRLDGTEGLSWEINSIRSYLHKVLFVAYDNASYDAFLNILKGKELVEYTGFPKPLEFPSVIWRDEAQWYWGDPTCIEVFMHQHPWQEASVDYVYNSLVIQSTFAGTNKAYIIDRFPTFIKGNKGISLKLPIGIRFLYAIFPFSQQYGKLGCWSKNTIIYLITNLYLVWGVFAYYCILFFFAYVISENNGGCSLNNTGLRFCVYSFISLLPIYVLSFINGPKSLKIGNLYLSNSNFIQLIKNNFIKGLIVTIFTLGAGFYTKHNGDVRREQRKVWEEQFYPKQQQDEYYCKKHIDSIFTNIIASYVFAYLDELGGIDVISHDMARLELDFHQSIIDNTNATKYYPPSRDSLMTDDWYMNVAKNVIEQYIQKQTNN